MTDPLTTEDLYGTSNKPGQDTSTPAESGSAPTTEQSSDSSKSTQSESEPKTVNPQEMHDGVPVEETPEIISEGTVNPSTELRTGSKQETAESGTPVVENAKKVAESAEPKAESFEQKAESRKQKTKSKELRTEHQEPKVPDVGSDSKQTTKSSSGCLGIVVKLLLFVGLIAIGAWGADTIRQYIPDIVNRVTTQTPRLSPTPTTSEAGSLVPTVGESITGGEPGASGVSASWVTYDVISGSTRQPFGGVTFQLPPDVLSPICDGSNCASQGTYLPGGTRFTVAPRGAGQLLADYRGTAIADVAGVTFTTKDTTVAGLPALEFSGTFTGGTVSGYSFSRMHGVMIALTPTTSLEVNHFTPSGIIADFASDDTLFDEILKTISTVGVQKGSTGQ